MKCEIEAKTPINTTEDVEKVIKSLSNMLDYDQLEIHDRYLLVTGDKDSLLRLRESLKKRRIRNSARKILLKGAHDKVVFFYLNKQAAFSGAFNITEDNLSPLGEIKVKIETDNIEEFIDWLAPLQE